MKATKFAAAALIGCAFVAGPATAQVGELAEGVVETTVETTTEVAETTTETVGEVVETIPEIIDPPPPELVEPPVVSDLAEPEGRRVIEGASAPMSAAWAPAAVEEPLLTEEPAPPVIEARTAAPAFAAPPPAGPIEAPATYALAAPDPGPTALAPAPLGEEPPPPSFTPAPEGGVAPPTALAALSPAPPAAPPADPEPLVAGAVGPVPAAAPIVVAQANPAPVGPTTVRTQPARVVSYSPTLYAPPPAPGGDYVGSISPVVTWTGFYVGASVSGSWADFDVGQTRNPPLVGPETSSFSAEANGTSFGLLAGYDWQFTPTIVAGLFASYDFNSQGFFFAPNPGQGWGVELGNVWTIAGRAGWLISPRALLYGLVGFSGSQVALSYNDTIPNPNLTYAGTDWVGGITAGLGVEAMFGPHVSARFEYRYTNFGAASVGGTAPGSSGTTTADITEQSVRGAIVYRFGGQ